MPAMNQLPQLQDAPFWFRHWNSLGSPRNSQSSMAPEISSSCSQYPITGPYPEPVQTIPHPHIFTPHNARISSNLCSGTPCQITSVNRFRNFNLRNTQTARDIRLYVTSGFHRDGVEVSAPLERYAALISI